MKVNLPESGVYVLATSGGVDSMALLHMLYQKKLQSAEPLVVVVAHLDHGIRQESEADRRLVQEVAGIYGMPFVYDEAELGADASEAEARQIRYEFLDKVRKNSLAEAIITAHHGDDVLETAVMNISRGYWSKGTKFAKKHRYCNSTFA
jgi:tRNA(Ile)-lysidine synthase